MYRVYLGNLEEQVTEDVIQKLFADHSLTVTGILIKGGYGFVDCPDQTTFDQAIDRLNGYNLMGSVLQVEPSTVSKRRKSNRIQIRNLPASCTKDDVQHLVAAFGTVQRCDMVSNSMDKSVTVVYQSSDEAQYAIEQLNNYDYQGSILRAEFTNSSASRSRNTAGDHSSPSRSGCDYSLRIFVPSEYVGALIGKKGQTIRNITVESKVTRIDVHGKDNSSLSEKIVTITGSSESVTKACSEILTIMQQESVSNNGGCEVVLKILADDRYCGRVIGKEGRVIKKIREDTNTRIVVSSMQEMPAVYPDRIIMVRGPVANMSQAEAAISVILRECMEKNIRISSSTAVTHSYSNIDMYGPRPAALQPVVKSLYGGIPHPTGRHPGHLSPNLASELHIICVPSTAIGSIIGSGGANIKQIIRDSGAFCTVDSKKENVADQSSERVVTIKGSPASCWKASFFIYEKMKVDGFAGYDDVRLKTAIRIPKTAVGRLIGKGGKTVREIQRCTGSIIKLSNDIDSNCKDDQTMVFVYGSFSATQGAYSRIRNILSRVRQTQLPGTGSVLCHSQQ